MPVSPVPGSDSIPHTPGGAGAAGAGVDFNSVKTVQFFHWLDLNSIRGTFKSRGGSTPPGYHLIGCRFYPESRGN